jgi:DNA-binding transcriptional MerR regulator
LLRIGSVAAQTGVSVDTLRFYERRGLLRPAGRRASGYREYSDEAIRLVRFIRRAQALGFTLAEVEELVRMRDRAWAGDGPRQLREAAVSKVDDIDRRLRELRALRGALARLISACDEACPAYPSAEPVRGQRGAGRAGVDGTRTPALDCPLIEALEAESVSVPEEARKPTRESGSPKRGRRSTQRKTSPAVRSRFTRRNQ